MLRRQRCGTDFAQREPPIRKGHVGDDARAAVLLGHGTDGRCARRQRSGREHAAPAVGLGRPHQPARVIVRGKLVELGGHAAHARDAVGVVQRLEVAAKLEHRQTLGLDADSVAHRRNHLLIGIVGELARREVAIERGAQRVIAGGEALGLARALVEQDDPAGLEERAPLGAERVEAVRQTLGPSRVGAGHALAMPRVRVGIPVQAAAHHLGLQEAGMAGGLRQVRGERVRARLVDRRGRGGNDGVAREGASAELTDVAVGERRRLQVGWHFMERRGLDAGRASFEKGGEILAATLPMGRGLVVQQLPHLGVRLAHVLDDASARVGSVVAARSGRGAHLQALRERVGDGVAVAAQRRAPAAKVQLLSGAQAGLELIHGARGGGADGRPCRKTRVDDEPVT